MEKLLCFDYDMTLLDHATGKVPESTQRAIALLRPTWKIVIATGRDMRQPASTYGVQTVQPDAIVEMNGARIFAEGEVLYQYFLPQDLLHGIITFGRQNDLCISCNQGDAYYTTKPELLRSFVYTCVQENEIVTRPAEELFGRQVSALALVGGQKEARMLEKEFPQVKVPLFAKKRGADIIPRSLSKAEGVQRLLRFYNSSFDNVIFFGDSGNDLELISAANLGIAMGNAIPPVQQAADYVTTAVGSDGIWNALAHFGLLPGTCGERTACTSEK
ncbi:MAG: HAD-IIB family hydrolase [Oscillospiraceae bacterium]|nr:HAD-IIB family hydrolase [Oscillospiraceae bacterium]